MKRPEDWTIIKLIQWTTTYFQKHDIASARIDAELILAFALGLERIDLYLRHDQPLNPDELGRFRGLIKRRADREPVAYITGTKEFWGLELRVAPAVLIPRPETECLVEAAVAFVKRDGAPAEPRCLDLGTGTGAIALALAHEMPSARVTALDRSSEALAIADHNRRRHDLQDRIRLLAGDWLSPFASDRADFDLIVSNPPYIPTGQIDGLQPEITRYEPRAALDGGPEGLDCIALLIRKASKHMAPGGALFMEIGHDQFKAVEALAQATGRYRHIACRQDYSGQDRVVRLVSG